MEIKENLTNINYNSGNNRTIEYIVIHYTANKTDTAYNNTKYFKDIYRAASAHYFVDDDNIYQCVEDKDISWNCGDHLKAGSGGKYYNKCTNRNSIGIEMCCTNYDVSPKTVENTINLTKQLMNKYGIDANHVIRHFDVTNKICPKPFVENESRWQDFKTRLGGSYTPIGTNTQPINRGTSYTGNITYQSYDNNKRRWLPEVINDRDYAGNFGHSLGGLRARCTNGLIHIQTHVKGGNWLQEVNSSTYLRNSMDGNSYAGIFGKEIDGIKVWSDKGHVNYRVHLINGRWLDWVDSRDVHKTDGSSYAGIYGIAIDGIQMK